MTKKQEGIMIDKPARAALRGLVALYDMRAVPGVACEMVVFEGEGETTNVSQTHHFIGIDGHPHEVAIEVVRDPGQEPDRAWHPHRAWPNWGDPAGRLSWIKLPVGHWS
jgi:hypothetical protein